MAAFVVDSAVTGVSGTQQRCIAALSSSERGKSKRTPERASHPGHQGMHNTADAMSLLEAKTP